jgi:uncharacterized repeat protein (TIGR01451 family)
VTLSHDPALPNDPITYTIVVYNTGLADAVGVHITDTLPNGVIGTSVDVTQTVAANDAVTITVPATVANDAPWGATIVNTAYYEHSTGTGSADAAFRVKDMYFLYLPLVTKN